jgi:hypothetical protein
MIRSSPDGAVDVQSVMPPGRNNGWLKDDRLNYAQGKPYCAAFLPSMACKAVSRIRTDGMVAPTEEMKRCPPFLMPLDAPAQCVNYSIATQVTQIRRDGMAIATRVKVITGGLRPVASGSNMLTEDEMSPPNESTAFVAGTLNLRTRPLQHATCTMQTVARNVQHATRKKHQGAVCACSTQHVAYAIYVSQGSRTTQF